jgi:tetratricopeptide (TPR) repeat protein
MKNTNLSKSILAAALGLTLGLASCSGEASAKDLNAEGESALQSMEFDTAKASYESALTAIGDDTANAEYKTAKLGLIECLAHLDQAADCVTEFTKLAEAGGLEATDYSYIGGILASVDQVSEAIAVASQGIKAFPGDTGLDAVLKTLAEKAKISGNPDDNEALSGLGYL